MESMSVVDVPGLGRGSLSGVSSRDARDCCFRERDCELARADSQPPHARCLFRTVTDHHQAPRQQGPIKAAILLIFGLGGGGGWSIEVHVDVVKRRMSEDAAALTRWLFEDFELAYDAKFGRHTSSTRNDPKSSETRSTTRPSLRSIAAVSMGNGASVEDRSSGTEDRNGGGVVMTGTRKPGRELAPYEKYGNRARAAAAAEEGAAHEVGTVPAMASANGEARREKEKPGWQKPLPEFYALETALLAESIMQDIVKGDLDVQWDSIKGLDNAKRLLKEAVVMPIKYPQYFTGLLTPWKGILLFGPPGTGKVTHLGLMTFCLNAWDTD